MLYQVREINMTKFTKTKQQQQPLSHNKSEMTLLSGGIWGGGGRS